MTRNYTKILILLLIIFLFLPVGIFAQELPDAGAGFGQFIPCAGPDCNFGHLLALVNNVLAWIVNISFAAAIITFSWAGFVLLTSGGNPGKKDEAKKMLTKVIIGFAIILSARLIVYTITSVILKDGIVTF